MSRIGNKSIAVPQGVEVNADAEKISVKGPKGTLETPIFEGIVFKQEDGVISLNREDNSPDVRAKHGLTRALLANCIQGVHQGFEKNLEIVGVGFRAAVKGKVLNMNLGFSHEVNFPIPEDLTIEVEANTKLKIKGIDKQRVGQVAAEIRSLRPPEPYKGKGIRYADEYIRRKAGKTGK